MEPLVSIVSLAYNHEPYIRQALDGFLQQKTTFNYEVVIHDDASTDKTLEIIREYEKKYPEIIKPIYQKENQKSKGGGIVTRTAFSAARGKYIALCESDDYWTDPCKLQKQVDFLQANPEYSACFHNMQVIYEDKNRKSHLSNDFGNKAIFSIEDLVKGNFIYTASYVFRNILIGNIPKFLSYVTPGDWPLFIINAKSGKIKFFNEVMGVYRVHKSGAWSSIDILSKYKNIIVTLEEINKYLKYEYKTIIEPDLARHLLAISILCKKDRDYRRSKKYFYRSFKAISYFGNDKMLFTIRAIIFYYFPFSLKIASIFSKNIKAFLDYGKN